MASRYKFNHKPRKFDTMKENIEYYKGSLSNIIGLPIEDIKKYLEGLK